MQSLTSAPPRYFIHSSVALQPFVRPWPFLQFRNLLYTDGGTPWTSDQPVARQLPTHRRIQIDAHRGMYALSEIRTHDPSFGASEDSSCLRQRGHCDRHHLAMEAPISACPSYCSTNFSKNLAMEAPISASLSYWSTTFSTV
jgi:hypothetical protein